MKAGRSTDNQKNLGGRRTGRTTCLLFGMLSLGSDIVVDCRAAGLPFVAGRAHLRCTAEPPRRRAMQPRPTSPQAAMPRPRARLTPNPRRLHPTDVVQPLIVRNAQRRPEW
jgi:hypothetical protein